MKNIIIAFLIGALSVSLAFSNLKDGTEESIDFDKQDKITFATRAPTSADKGRFWITYTANNDTTITLYIRHPNTGIWRSEAFN